MGYGGYVPPSGAGTDYGYIGGGFYVPTPYVAPKPVVKPKPAPAPKPVAGGVNYGTPVYHNPKSSASNSSNWKPKPATPAQHQQEAIANGVQIAGVNAPRKAAATKAVQNVAGRVSSATSSGGGGGGGGGGGTSAASSAPVATPAVTAPAAAPAATPAAAPVPTTRDVVIPDITIDPLYQRQVADLAKQLADATTNNTSAKADYDTTYNSTLQNLGWDAAKKHFMADNPNTQYGSAFRGNLEDYSGRGDLYSSDYVKDLGNLNNTFNNQVGQLGTARNQFRGAQDTSLAQYEQQNTSAKSDALAYAAARIAANLGIDQAQVPLSGGSKTITVPIVNPTPSA